jgi:hypothetical protein
MTRAWTAAWIAGAMLLLGVASAAVTFKNRELADILIRTKLDALPFQMGLILGVVIAMAVVIFSLKRTARRDRCLMALQALLFFCLFLNGVEFVTLPQLAMGACMIGVLGFLALGRFEPKTPEPRP